MKDFLDRIVARVGRQETSLRPRVAHRFGPPEHHIASSQDPPEPGRLEDEDVAAEGDLAGSIDEPAGPARATSPLSAGGRSAAAAEAGSATGAAVETGSATGAAAASPGQGEGSAALPSFALARPDDGNSAAQSTFVGRLRARLGDASGGRAPGAAPLRDPAVATPSPGSLDVAAVPSVTGPATAKVSRAAENEAEFWRFLYGPQAEAPTTRRQVAEEARAAASADERATTGASSGIDARAAVTGVARATMAGGAPTGPMSITIGRVEVRGLPPPVAPRPAPVPARRSPRLGLADYMRQTAPGARRR